MTETAEILMLSQEPEHIRRWGAYLAGQGARLWLDAAAVPPDVAIDVIVTDQVARVDQLVNQQLSGPLRVGEIGVVRIGWKHSADVCLPADVTARELRLACSLLTETVRLRREVHTCHRMRDTLNEFAMTDPLTGLPNRRAWDDRLVLCALSGDGASDCVCVALLDLDHFKRVNDRFGHLAGDRLLCYVGRQLALLVGKSSFVARLGGDEFAMLFGGCLLSDWAARIEKTRILACAEAPHRVTASVGLAVASKPEECDPLRLLDAADTALRRAKAAGRNRSVVVHAAGREDRE